MKGIILAGGAGTRLYPCTKVTSKQLLPVYNKPMIYYPLDTLIRAGIKEILIIIAPDKAGDFLRLLGSGRDFGCKFSYEIQDKPEGLAQAFIIGENFIGEDDVTMILGDNLFDEDFSDAIKSFKEGGRIFVKEVPDPHKSGIIELGKNDEVLSIEEKPKNPKSNLAITGLYVFDNTVIKKSKSLKPSARGELEITDIQKMYLAEGKLDVRKVNNAWLDTGDFDSWLAACNYIQKREKAKEQNKG